MKTTILANGNLEVALTAEDDRDEVRERMSGYNWTDIFEQEFCNGWGPVPPEAIGALTDAPILTDDLSVEDDGTPVVLGRVWWFPNYQVEDPAETLANEGRVVFTLAPRS